MNNKKVNKIAVVSALVFNSLLLIAAVYYLSDFANAQEQQQRAKIKLFEDYSGEIVNGSKHLGFTYNLSEPGVDKLLFEDGKILFSNGTVLLS